MAKKVTINRVRVELQAIQEAHLQLNDFYWGDFLRAIKRKEVQYPLLCCYKVNGTMLRNTSPLNLIIIVADRVYKGHENLNDTESDTHQALRDIKTVITRSERWNALGAVEIIGNIEGFIDRSADEVSGHILRITMRMNDADNICDLPLSGYDFGEQYTDTDPPTIIINSDQTFMQALAAGSVYELPDIHVVDSDGGEYDTPAQTEVICSPALPVTVHNSDNTYEELIAAGGDLPLPDIQVTDSTGVQVSVPAQTDFMCTPQVVCEPVTVHNSNNTYDETVPAGDDLPLPDITVSNSNDSFLLSSPSVVDVEIPDETINIYVDGNLEATGERPPLSNEDVLITLSF